MKIILNNNSEKKNEDKINEDQYSKNKENNENNEIQIYKNNWYTKIETKSN